MSKFQLYDKISTRVPSPFRVPQADAVQRLREVEELLREADRSALRATDRADLRELLDILSQPHMRVSCFSFFQFNYGYATCKQFAFYNVRDKR